MAEGPHPLSEDLGPSPDAALSDLGRCPFSPASELCSAGLQLISKSPASDMGWPSGGEGTVTKENTRSQTPQHPEPAQSGGFWGDKESLSFLKHPKHSSLLKPPSDQPVWLSG